MVRYPIVLEPDDETIRVTFPDFPEAQTFGEDRDEALMRARDALATVIEAYIRDRRDLPTPSTIVKDSAALSALMSAKVELYTAMRAAGVTKSELARRLQCHMPQVDRLLDLKHGSQLGQLEAAVIALGGSMDVSLRLPSMPGTTRRRSATAEHVAEVGRRLATKRASALKRTR